MLIDEGVSPDQVQRDDLGHRRRGRGPADPTRRVPPLVVGHALGRPAGGRQSDRVHRRDRARRPHLPLRRHVHLRHAADRRAVPADRRAARLHAAAGAARTGSRARRRSSPARWTRTRRPAPPRCSGSSSPSPATTSRPTRRSSGSSSSCPKYDTTGRRRVVAPLVGETLVVDGERHSDRREGRVRLVTYTAAGTTGVGVRRTAAIFDAGYADMHALIADGSRGARARRGGGRRVGAPSPAPRSARAASARARSSAPGVNYASHADENPDAKMPEEPFFFSKLPSAVIGPGEPIRDSARDDADRLRGRAVDGDRDARLPASPRSDALDHVFGWTVLHDVSARDVQFKDVADHARQEPGHLRAARARDRDAPTSSATGRRCASRRR